MSFSGIFESAIFMIENDGDIKLSGNGKYYEVCANELGHLTAFEIQPTGADIGSQTTTGTGKIRNRKHS